MSFSFLNEYSTTNKVCDLSLFRYFEKKSIKDLHGSPIPFAVLGHPQKILGGPVCTKCAAYLVAFPNLRFIFSDDSFPPDKESLMYV